MRTSNPIFSQRFTTMAHAAGGSGSMTINGTLDKAVILLFLVLISASYTWNRFLDESTGISSLMLLGLIGGFLVALVTTFKPSWSPITAPIYALLQGLFLGGISVYLNFSYPGLPFQAVGLTFTILLVMLGLYRFRIIRVTDRLRSGIMSATGAIMLFYMATWVLGFFGVHVGSFMNNSPLGLGLSLIIVGVAAFNLLLNFDFIERASSQGYPAYMNWVGAFGLMVTLVWLYLEILRLLSRMRD